MNSTLIIFVKNPIKGKVKTRLAADVGDERAYNIYLKLLDKTHKECRNLPFDKVVYYSGVLEREDLWEENIFRKKKQRGEDLGKKMFNAFEEAFREGYDQVCIIGSDCFEITENIIESAFNNLKKTDVVIGPSADGGYYLLGMNYLINEIFENKPWSEPHLLRTTLDELTDSEISYTLLPQLNDIDTIADIVQPELIKILNQ